MTSGGEHIIDSRTRPQVMGLTSILCLAALGTGSSFAGDDDRPSPYRIRSVEQLQGMTNNLSAHYVIAEDIDASSTAEWNGGKGFCPVGDGTRPFTGSFDGQGHSITGLKINRFGMVTTHIGLFGVVGRDALIRNVTLRKAYVKGCDYVGALVGINQGTVRNCYASGEVYGSGTFGGLVGANNQGEVTHCSAAVDVGPVWVGNHLGGLVGCNNKGTIRDSFAAGKVTGQENPGGLAGVNAGGVIERCYASGAVSSTFVGSSDDYRRGAGGLVAQHQGGRISDCFATGPVTGPAGLPVGGLVGTIDGEASVGNSYCRESRETPLAGVGKVYPGSGLVECESLVKLGAELFAASGPLACWDFRKTWAFDESPTATTCPRFRTLSAEDELRQR